MSSEYIYRLNFVVPEALIEAANNLALLIGESEYDIYTYSIAEYQDLSLNKYAVCSTVVKQESLDILESDGFNITIPEHASQVDMALVQQILSTRVFYKVGDVVLTDRIMISKDIEPSAFFETIGLTLEGQWY